MRDSMVKRIWFLQDELPLDEIDVLFFCTAHGDTKKFMDSHNVPEDLKNHRPQYGLPYQE
ncbi:hypothetical protein [Phocaeicola dorei]|uniref:hypothetical protein n=1 Tax=Phocaeicola dorei TaxID=357276 RepID=UPI0026D49594